MARKLSQKERRRRRKSNQRILSISKTVLLFGIIYLLFQTWDYMENQRLASSVSAMYYSNQHIEAPELKPQVVILSSELDTYTAKTPTESGIITMECVEDIPRFNAEFMELYERNNDTVGWIHSMEDIDYPIVQRDNQYYLTHDYDGNTNSAGWIFLDERNSSTMDDDNILIYGHNMRVGTMFGELDNYKYPYYIANYPIFEIHSIYESAPRYYVIWGVLEASMNVDSSYFFDVDRIVFENNEAKENYIEQIRQLSVWNIPISVDSSDNLATLITCSYYHDNGRLMVIGRELRENEDVTNIQSIFGAFKENN